MALLNCDPLDWNLASIPLAVSSYFKTSSISTVNTSSLRCFLNKTLLFQFVVVGLMSLPRRRKLTDVSRTEGSVCSTDEASIMLPPTLRLSRFIFASKRRLHRLPPWWTPEAIPLYLSAQCVPQSPLFRHQLKTVKGERKARKANRIYSNHSTPCICRRMTQEREIAVGKF